MGYLTKAQNYFRTSALIGLSLLCSGCGSEGEKSYDKFIMTNIQLEESNKKLLDSNTRLVKSNEELVERIGKLEERVKTTGETSYLNERTQVARENEKLGPKKEIILETITLDGTKEEKFNQIYEALRFNQYEIENYPKFSLSEINEKDLKVISGFFPKMDINNLTEIDKIFIYKVYQIQGAIIASELSQ